MSILNVFDLILTFIVQYYKWVENVIWVGVDVWLFNVQKFWSIICKELNFYVNKFFVALIHSFFVHFW